MVVQRRKRPDIEGQPALSPSSKPDVSSDSLEVYDKEKEDIRLFSTVMQMYNACRVLTTILLLSSFFVIFHSASSNSALSHRIDDRKIREYPKVIEEGLDELPPIELDPDIAKDDAFGIAQHYLKNYTSRFMKEAQKLQADYARLYGGIRSARHLLQNTLHEFGGDSWVRLLQGKRDKLLHMVVIGHGTAAGYQNRHDQSFSFILQRILQPIMSLFQIQFVLSNIALGNVASFPYLWCIQEHISGLNTQNGTLIDVVFLDLDQSTSVTDTEIILRQVIGLSTPPPLLVIRGTKGDADLLDLLQHYIDGNSLKSPVLMDWKDAVVPFLMVKPSKRPLGFHNWSEGISLDSTKAMGYWTPNQHNLVAWTLSIFLLKHMELLVACNAGYYQLNAEEKEQIKFHDPILARASALKDPWSVYLYYPSESRKCLTSNGPARNLLPMTEFSKTSNHSNTYFESQNNQLGWKLDLDESEKKKSKILNHEGFHDILASFYGSFSSGALTFDLDVESMSQFIICNSQSINSVCRLDRDVSFLIDDEKPKSVTKIISDLISYNGFQNCALITLNVPKKGKIKVKVEVAKNGILRENHVCSISHIVWQKEDSK
jgi:hypothetical protein